MKKLHIFPEELEYIIKKKSLIPRKVPNGNKFKLRRKYYIPGADSLLYCACLNKTMEVLI